MSLALPIYKLGSSYYLHTRIEGRQVKRSLKTAYKREAIIRAIALLNSMTMTTRPNPRGLSTYELDISKGILKADGEEDHARLMQAIEAMKLLHSGNSSATNIPAQDTKSVPAPIQDDSNTLKLNELLEKFFLLRKSIAQATAISYNKIIDEFTKFLKNPPITKITQSDITRYQEYLATKNTPRTIDNKISTVRALFNFAKKHGYTKQDNPAQDKALLTKKQKLKGGFAIFEPDEIRALINSEFFKKQIIKDKDYSACVMLALFTGCRIGELTNLKKSQFKTSPTGIPYITIRDSKTMAGIREVPLHSFISKYMQDFMTEKPDKIFKYEEIDGKGAGNAVGKKFARHVDESKLTRDKLVFHSLRKFVNNELMKNRVSLEHRCQFIGHELDNVNVAVYTDKINIDELGKSVFPTFDKILEIIKPEQKLIEIEFSGDI